MTLRTGFEEAQFLENCRKGIPVLRLNANDVRMSPNLRDLGRAIPSLFRRLQPSAGYLFLLLIRCRKNNESRRRESSSSSAFEHKLQQTSSFSRNHPAQ